MEANAKHMVVVAFASFFMPITLTKSVIHFVTITSTTKHKGWLKNTITNSYKANFIIRVQKDKEEKNMRYIFVDFEMNPIEASYKEEKKICGSEIIEIGAVMPDENFNEISSYKRLVKPQYNSRIYKNWEILTGITTEMVSSAEHFEKAIEEFISWCGEDYEIYAWSNSDRIQVMKEMKLKKIYKSEECEYMLSHWLDFQKIYGEIVSEEKLVSLENALCACGIPFSGRKHDALYDARNTSLLFAESKINDLAELVKDVRDAMCQKVEETTLGDIFNFEQLGFSFA